MQSFAFCDHVEDEWVTVDEYSDLAGNSGATIQETITVNGMTTINNRPDIRTADAGAKMACGDWTAFPAEL